MRRALKLSLAIVTGLLILAGSGLAVAEPSFSIAPFRFQAKQKIYTFAYPTYTGYTFLGSRHYVPRVVARATAGGPLTGPVLAHAPSGRYYVSNYYAFNPYWGAQHSPGIGTPSWQESSFSGSAALDGPPNVPAAAGAPAW